MKSGLPFTEKNEQYRLAIATRVIAKYAKRHPRGRLVGCRCSSEKIVSQFASRSLASHVRACFVRSAPNGIRPARRANMRSM